MRGGGGEEDVELECAEKVGERKNKAVYQHMVTDQFLKQLSRRKHSENGAKSKEQTKNKRIGSGGGGTHHADLGHQVTRGGELDCWGRGGHRKCIKI